MKNSKENGITLIALIVTVIVLLILAGVSISVLTGENGILEQASNAKEATDSASELESVTLAVNGAIMASDNFVVEESLLNSELSNYFDTYSVSGDDESGFTITIGTKRYAVTTTGSITKIGDVWYEDDSADTYYISSAFQLCELSDLVNSGEDTFDGKTVYLTANIDMNEVYDAGYEFDVIGNTTYNFEGTFDGNMYEISGFNSPTYGSYTAMFLDVYGTIENLGIVDSDFTGVEWAASFASDVYGNIENCWSSGNTISGEYMAAGIACYPINRRNYCILLE